MSYTPIVPDRVGGLLKSYGLLFSCRRCSRHAAYDRHELVRRFGEEARIKQLAARFRCGNCKGRGADFEVRSYSNGMTEGQRVKLARTALDRLVEDLKKVQPEGTCTVTARKPAPSKAGARRAPRFQYA